MRNGRQNTYPLWLGIGLILIACAANAYLVSLRLFNIPGRGDNILMVAAPPRNLQYRQPSRTLAPTPVVAENEINVFLPNP